MPRSKRGGAATMAGTSYSALGAYVAAIVAANPLVYDWTALLPNSVLVLPR